LCTAGRSDAMRGMTRFLVLIAAAFLLIFAPQPAQAARGPGTIEDLKKIEIICFAPTWLPKGFKVESVAITYDEPGPDEGGGRFPLYSIEYTNGRGQSFSINCAREGIGDRNLLDTDDSEDAEISSPLGRMFIIYTPKGKAGRKSEIRSNWTSDANMIAEKAKNEQAHPVLGRYHGFTGTGMTVAEFRKIIDSLRPIR
jgi:hypothetical protein